MKIIRIIITSILAISVVIVPEVDFASQKKEQALWKKIEIYRVGVANLIAAPGLPPEIAIRKILVKTKQIKIETTELRNKMLDKEKRNKNLILNYVHIEIHVLVISDAFNKLLDCYKRSCDEEYIEGYKESIADGLGTISRNLTLIKSSG